MKYVVCRYSEIALKGKNRRFFEEKLVESIKRVLRPDFFSFVKRISGRILIELTDEGIKNKEEIEKSIGFVFGVSNFSFCENSSQNIEDIKKTLKKILCKKEFQTFRISAKRADKKFPFSSREINEEAGRFVLDNFRGVKVNLSNPEITCFVEIVEKYAFLSIEKIKGLGGLPAESAGKAVVLLSGGIDSPVAGFLAMKRGVEAVFVHFHSYPETPQASIEKVKELVGILSRYQKKPKLFLVPISDLQREIVLSVPEKLRVIFYRRIMYKIAERIAEKEDARAIITGDSIGQVASQTLDNMKAIQYGMEALIIRPLACQDKDIIVKQAKEIETFNVSILPHDDCCSRFIPAHPETKAKIEEVLKEEKKLDISGMIEKAIQKTKIFVVE